MVFGTGANLPNVLHAQLQGLLFAHGLERSRLLDAFLELVGALGRRLSQADLLLFEHAKRECEYGKFQQVVIRVITIVVECNFNLQSGKI